MTDARSIRFGPCERCLHPICQCPQPDARREPVNDVPIFVPRICRNDGMIEEKEIAHYNLDLTRYVSVSDYRALADQLDKLQTSYDADMQHWTQRLAEVERERDDLRDKCDPSYLTAPVLRLTDGVVTIQWADGARGAVVVRELIDQWIETRNHLAALTLTWTTTRPTVAGWYWWRGESDLNELICWVSSSLDVLFINRPLVSVDVLDGEWAGPIARPKEAT